MTHKMSPDSPTPTTAYTSQRNFGESKWPLGKTSNMMRNNTVTFPPGAFQNAERSTT